MFLRVLKFVLPPCNAYESATGCLSRLPRMAFGLFLGWGLMRSVFW